MKRLTLRPPTQLVEEGERGQEPFLNPKEAGLS
jgi:hypothetical protein